MKRVAHPRAFLPSIRVLVIPTLTRHPVPPQEKCRNFFVHRHFTVYIIQRRVLDLRRLLYIWKFSQDIL